MSEINCFGTEENYGELVEGWYLVRYRGDRVHNFSYGPTMKDGDWGLTFSNDPSFVITRDPLPRYSKSTKYREVGDAWGNGLNGPIEHCHSLMEACMLAGYNPKKERLRYWLMHRAWDHLKALDWKPVTVSTSD